MSIFSANYEIATLICIFKFYPGDPKPQIVQLGKAIYLIIEPMDDIAITWGAEVSHLNHVEQWSLSSDVNVDYKHQ